MHDTSTCLRDTITYITDTITYSRSGHESAARAGPLDSPAAGERPPAPAGGGSPTGYIAGRISPTNPCDSSSGPALNQTARVPPVAAVPGSSPHSPSIAIGLPAAVRSWPMK